jgi:hypothetical protein
MRTAYLVSLGLTPSHDYVMGTSPSKGLGVGLGLAAYGLYKLVNGIINLARPQSEHLAISDVTL